MAFQLCAPASTARTPSPPARRDRPWRPAGPVAASDASPGSRTLVVSDVCVLHPPVNDKLLLIDGPRYDGSTIVASLEDGLAYPNLNLDFDNSTTRRQDRGTRAPLAGDYRIGSPPCSATRWAYRMRDASGAITMYIMRR